MTNTIGYVTTEKTMQTADMRTSLDLDSSVEVNFKSDYLPLNRMATSSQVDRIRQSTRNPDAERAIADRTAADARADSERRQSLDRVLAPQQPGAPRPSSVSSIPQGQPRPRSQQAQQGQEGTQQHQQAQQGQQPPRQQGQQTTSNAPTQTSNQPQSNPSAP